MERPGAEERLVGIFEPKQGPRVYALPPGCDFPSELVSGFLSRASGLSHAEVARAEIFLNTQANMRAVVNEFASKGPMLLPKLTLVSRLSDDLRFPDIPGPVSRLRRVLELTQAVGKLLEADERFGSNSAAFDLARSLAALMDEMQGEGVSPETLRSLDVSDHSSHWANSLEFISLIDQHWGADSIPDVQARRRLVIERMSEEWERNPPSGPVIVAGSTGSRGATRLLMKIVANLPQGAVVLPCYDFDLPPEAWTDLSDSNSGENHPQYRMKQFLEDAELDHSEVQLWRPAAPSNPARNKLVSLALRPAPVTDRWMLEGPRLEGIADAVEDMTLIEAPTPQLEAAAVALTIRQAVEDGTTVAFVTQDRLLVRQVKAVLERWELVPFDGAGVPVTGTAQGRFLSMIADQRGKEASPAAFIALLKHPAAAAGKKKRRGHMRWTRRLDLELRRTPTGAGMAERLREISEDEEQPEEYRDWLRWAAGILDRLARGEEDELASHVGEHREIAEIVAAGCGGKNPKLLWKGRAGEAAQSAIKKLHDAADAGGRMDPVSYARLFKNYASESVIWEPYAAHPNVQILSTIEARMRNPDILVMGGLNEGIWPSHPPSDPWLNRPMRREAGLLSPERRIGLMAHDFQQAIAARKVVLTRSIRDADAPTLPSRWLSRITSLLDGIGETGTAALAGMQERGRRWVELAEALDEPDAPSVPAARPSPAPPAEARPKTISVTEVAKLISDPYAVYARRILKLRPLALLTQVPDELARGNAIHQVMEAFAENTKDDLNPDATILIELADRTFRNAPIPERMARLWFANLLRNAEEFMRFETIRRKRGLPFLIEQKAEFELPDLDIVLAAKTDRVDRDEFGSLCLYDYKTGTIPTPKRVLHEDKQLPLQAKMLELGAFGEEAQGTVQRAAYIKIGSSTDEKEIPRELKSESGTENLFESTWIQFLDLVEAYQDPGQGYTSRRSILRGTYGRDYDHLARYGEWEDSDEPKTEAVG